MEGERVTLQLLSDWHQGRLQPKADAMDLDAIPFPAWDLLPDDRPVPNAADHAAARSAAPEHPSAASRMLRGVLAAEGFATAIASPACLNRLYDLRVSAR